MGERVRIAAYMAASTLTLAFVIFAANVGPGRRRLAVGRVVLVATLVSVIGIWVAKFGANVGLPWWIYYTAPMFCAVFIPPIVFRFSSSRSALYVVLAFLSAPAIHLAFVEALGWTDYMPFLKIPR
jgi:hypothetical protein